MGCLRSPLPGKEFRRASQRRPACDKEFGDGETPGGGCQNGRIRGRRSQALPQGVILQQRRHAFAFSTRAVTVSRPPW